MALKTRKVIGSSIDIKLVEALKELSDETLIPQSKLLDKAITLLLKEYGKEVEN